MIERLPGLCAGVLAVAAGAANKALQGLAEAADFENGEPPAAVAKIDFGFQIHMFLSGKMKYLNLVVQEILFAAELLVLSVLLNP